MKSAVTMVFGLIFILKSSCDEYMGQFVAWYPSLEYYKFFPKIGDCYELYDQSKKVSPLICQQPANPEKYSCIHIIKTGDRYCLGLNTPTNESALLLCENSEEELLSYHTDTELNNCFNISKPHTSYTEVCQQTYDNYSIGITTPDNFTMLFDSYFCSTSMSVKNRETYNNFVNTFSFDPETKSCYKVYNEDQKISPYTCLNEDVLDYCVEELPQNRNCEGITTENNETIILQCSDEKESLGTHNCLKIYTADNNLHIACQKKVEERCVGITTPSNLTVLLECYFCSKPVLLINIVTIKMTSETEANNKTEKKLLLKNLVETKNHKNRIVESQYQTTLILDCFCAIISKKFQNYNGIKYTSYNMETQRILRRFIKTYLSNEYLGKNSYLEKVEFEIIRPNSSQKYPESIYGYWLPNSTCYGFTLDSNETVILQCISNDRYKHQKPGCFVLSEQGTKLKPEQTVCIKILNERCVGITTPMNWSVALACYPERENPKSQNKILKEKYIKDTAEEYRLYPGLGNCYEMYSSQEINPYSCRRSANPKNYSCIDWIPGEKHCLGLKTPSNETIELVCGDSQENVLSYNTFSMIKNCFNIFSSDNLLGVVCQQKFGNYSIGVTTPTNYSILFDSFYCSAYKRPEEIQEYKEFMGNFSFDPSIRSCYKIYTVDQDISPYTCLSDEVHDACIHSLPNTDCMGITTQNNEIIVLKCLNDTRIVNETGCFKIYTLDNVVHTACLKQVEERCVGIITPSNLTVLLECYTCFSTKGGSGLPPYTDGDRKSYRRYVEYALYVFTQNNNALEQERFLRAYTPEQGIKLIDCYGEIKKYDIHTLHGHDNCRGITLDNLETVVLECPNKIPERTGCYDIFSPDYSKDNEIIGPDFKVANVCVKILNEWCVGITTPKNWTIPLRCYDVPVAACGIVQVPYNEPPPRV